MTSSILDKPMGPQRLLVMAIAVRLFILVQASEGTGKCSGATHFTIVYPRSPDRHECRKCPKCPPGQGLPITCGSTVSNGTSTDCIKCEPNKTYSKSRDSSTCKPCNICGLKNVLQICTRFQDRKCGTTCPPEHFLDELHDGCMQCYYCCDNVPEEQKLEKCKELNMPANMRCERTLENEKCKNSRSTSKFPSKTTPYATTVNQASPVVSKTYPESTSTKRTSVPQSTRELDSHSIPPSLVETDMQTTSSTTDAKNEASIIIASSIALVLFIIALAVVGKVFLTRFAKTRNRLRENGDQSGRCLLPVSADTKLSFIPRDKNLKDLPYEVMEMMQKLDLKPRGVKNWYHVGRKVNVPEQDLLEADLEYGHAAGSPTQVLINILCTKREVTLREFVKAIKEIGRNDIADQICLHYKQQSQGEATAESYV